jgi:ProP effector
MTTLAGLVSALADLYPRVFAGERWQPHKPLKIGIDADLIVTGVLTASEVEAALSCYTSRRMYLAATAAGGSRFDLNGHPAGEVTAQAAEWARAKVAHMDARPAREAKKAAEGRAWVEARRVARAAAESRNAMAASSQPPCQKTYVRLSSAWVRRLSRADLAAAAAARRASIAFLPVRPRGLEETVSE